MTPAAPASAPLAAAQPDRTRRGDPACRPRPADAVRIPPQDLRAEVAILGGIHLDPSALDHVRYILQPSDFYQERHRAIYEAIVSLADEEQPADLVTVRDRLRSRGQLETAGGEAALVKLVDDVVTAVHVEAHARIVRDRATLRRLANVATDLASRAWADGADVAGLLGEAERRIAELASASTPREKRLVVVQAPDLLSLDLPPREYVLAPWLREKDLAMLYGRRGCGKTWATCGIACAAASGGTFLRWTAPRPRRVLYVDGEMPAEMLRERVSQVILAGNFEVGDRLRFVTPDLQERGMPNLATPDGQACVEAHLEGGELLVLDNLSCLFRGVAENDADEWDSVQAWLLSLRRRGVTTLFDHHAGKAGQQRGTSKREDPLDSVIALRVPADYNPTQGARFEVHFEKARGVLGGAVEPFEARLDLDSDGTPSWTMRTLNAATHDRIVELAREGFGVSHIAKEIGKNKSVVSRHLKRAREAGVPLDRGERA